MSALRRLCSLLVVLALTLGGAGSVSCASYRAGLDPGDRAVAPGMGHPMSGGCADAAKAAGSLACALTFCDFCAVPPPLGPLPLVRKAAAFVMQAADGGAGLPGLPDPPPPRAFVHR